MVADGNFSMQNMHMKKPLEDVALTDKEGYGVEDKPYRVHLSESIDSKEVLLSNDDHIRVGRLTNVWSSEIDMSQSQSSQYRRFNVLKFENNRRWNLCLWKTRLLHPTLFSRLSKRREVSSLLFA